MTYFTGESPTTTIPGTPSPGFGFYDDVVFSISGATANSITSTLNLGDLIGISDLQVRLYSASLNPSLPVFGKPARTLCAIGTHAQPVLALADGGQCYIRRSIWRHA